MTDIGDDVMTATTRIAESKQRTLRNGADLPECFATREPKRCERSRMRQRLQLVVLQSRSDRHIVN
jgi:hypothetical protein